MAWTAPSATDYAVGEIVTAAKMNSNIANNLRYLKGLDGAVTIDNDLTSVLAAGGTLTAQGTNNSSFARLRMLTKQAAGTVVDWRLLANGISNAGELTFYDATAGAERMRIDNAGNVGINYTAPQGRLHVGGPGGGMVFLSAAGVAGSVITLAVAGTVTYGICGKYAIRSGAPATAGGDFSAGGGTLVPLGSSAAITVGADTVTIAVTAGGAITVQRTAGSNTHVVNLMIVYA